MADNKMVAIILFTLISLVAGDKHVCMINACDSLKEGKLFAEEFGLELMQNMTSNLLNNLERRIRSLEQPGEALILSTRLYAFGNC